MRLIDADELIKDRVENDPVRIAVKCAPTAFDKEKVIAELNVKADYARDRWLNPTKEGYSKYWDGKENGFREALEIVERGGIE